MKDEDAPIELSIQVRVLFILHPSSFIPNYHASSDQAMNRCKSTLESLRALTKAASSHSLNTIAFSSGEIPKRICVCLKTVSSRAITACWKSIHRTRFSVILVRQTARSLMDKE